MILVVVYHCYIIFIVVTCIVFGPIYYLFIYVSTSLLVKRIEYT